MAGPRTARWFAAPLVSAGIIGAAAIGLAGTANADSSTNTGSWSFVATPNYYASPAPSIEPWGQWVNEGGNSIGSNLSSGLEGSLANP